MTNEKRDRRLRILMSYARPTASTNPFISHLANGVGEHLDLEFLSVASMLWRRFDILHVHWPENLFRAAGAWRSFLKTAFGIILMLRVRLTRRPIVYTQHNRSPHDRPNRFYERLYDWVERSAIVTIYLNESAENRSSVGVTILHGDYPPVRAAAGFDTRRESDVVNLLFYGQLRRYKGVEDMLRALHRSADPDLRLQIRGAVADEHYGQEIEELVARDHRVDYRAGFVSDQELEVALASADVVVLPYKKLYNSGVALLALSRGLPLIAPIGPSMLSLREEVGEDFVMLFSGELTAEHLELARRLRRGAGQTAPDLSRRDWGTISELHRRLYVYTMENKRLGPKAVREAVAADITFIRHSSRNALAPGSRL